MAEDMRDEVHYVEIFNTENQPNDEDAVAIETGLAARKVLMGPITLERLDEIFEAVKPLRQLVSVEFPPIDSIIQSGVLPDIVNASLALANLPEHQTRGVKLQLEFAWILTNVSSGSSAQTQHVIDSGALKALTAIIKMPFVELQDQALWALSNIGSDGIVFRDLLLKEKISQVMYDCVKNAQRQPHYMTAFHRMAAWSLCTFLRHRETHPPFHEVADAIECALEYVDKSRDDEVLEDSFWALSYATRLLDLPKEVAIQISLKVLDNNHYFYRSGTQGITRILTNHGLEVCRTLLKPLISCLGQAFTPPTSYSARKKFFKCLTAIASSTRCVVKRYGPIGDTETCQSVSLLLDSIEQELSLWVPVLTQDETKQKSAGTQKLWMVFQQTIEELDAAKELVLPFLPSQ